LEIFLWQRRGVGLILQWNHFFPLNFPYLFKGWYWFSLYRNLNFQKNSNLCTYKTSRFPHIFICRLGKGSLGTGSSDTLYQYFLGWQENSMCLGFSGLGHERQYMCLFSDGWVIDTAQYLVY
jgi:hypothetical protein